MIDLTPLDVRKKKGDFRRGMRGYEPSVVDDFLDLVAERLEELVRENATLRQQTDHLSEAISTFREREQAMNEALVSAQQLREDMKSQASREKEITLRDARSEAKRIVAGARQQAEHAAGSLRRIQTQRGQFVRAFRAFVERQLMEIEQEEERIRDLVLEDADSFSSPDAQSAPGDEPPDWLSRIDQEREGTGS